MNNKIKETQTAKKNQIIHDWEYLKKIGEKMAARLGIETEEDVERIAG